MRLRQIASMGVLVGAFCVPAHAEARGRDTLAAGDGWAAYGAGTTGGAQVYTVTDRAGPVRALDHGSDTPKIIKVAGNGTALHRSGTLWGSPRTKSGGGRPLDLLAVHNAHHSRSERDLTADAGPTPTLHGKIDSAAVADREVARGAGAGRIP
ncbi:hypothetical protein U5640_34375 [Streptomyces sp. SS7]|uniref:hypothetical protein n=1 Tax=Streptomyces sp. SS7 TaxID=3108485 RepID=UPI0030EDC80D